MTDLHSAKGRTRPPQSGEGFAVVAIRLMPFAGSETTAHTLPRLFFYPKHKPQVLVKLREELHNTIPDASSIPPWADLQALPFLGAVIREALRLSYGVTTRLPRIAHEDIKYKGYIIPAGLEDGKPGRRLEKYLVAFGKGSRQCLGMNLADAELYLTVATVVWRFDWEQYEATLGN
ncbi:hypothetical protein OQA88_11593 [Cercophora sp. LCS_1]